MVFQRGSVVFKEGVWYLKRACGEDVWYLKRVCGI